MWETIRSLNASELAAWYAAIVSSVWLVLEIYKYIREGIDLKVKAKGNMVLAGPGHPGHGEKYVLVNVRHLNGPPTTITHIGVRKFESRFHKVVSYDTPQWIQALFRKTKLSEGHEFGFIVANEMCNFPQTLKIGNQWNCYIKQDDIPKPSGSKRTYVVVAHTLGDKEILARVEY